MKQLIVLCATIMLGLAIFGMIMGEQDNSIKSALDNVFRSEVVKQQEIYP